MSIDTSSPIARIAGEDLPKRWAVETRGFRHDADVLRFVVNALQSLVYETLAASNGADAMQLVREGTAIDLLLTDLILPAGMNGRETAENVQKEVPEMGLLYMSGYSEDADFREGKHGIHTRPLKKAFGHEELAREVRFALDKVQVREKSRSGDILDASSLW